MLDFCNIINLIREGCVLLTDAACCSDSRDVAHGCIELLRHGLYVDGRIGQVLRHIDALQQRGQARLSLLGITCTLLDAQPQPHCSSS